MVTGCEISNRFAIQENREGMPLFTMKENSNCCVRQCCKKMTPFDMEICDQQGQVQLKYERPFHCTNSGNCAPCCWICNPCAWEMCCGVQELLIKTANEQILGTVKEDPNAWCGLTSFTVYDADKTPKFVCLVPCCELCKQCCCQDVDLMVIKAGADAGDEEVAVITRECICNCVNVMTDKDHFEVKFNDQSLSALEKFYIMSLVILVKYNFFEEDSSGGGGGGG